MLFQVKMIVNPPKDMSSEEFDAIKLTEKEYEATKAASEAAWCDAWIFNQI